MKKNVSIRDVADKSGVSIATVSRILNKKPGVSQSAKEKVLTVCDTLGYRLNPGIQDLARKGRNNATKNIVFVMSGREFSDPAHSGALDGIAKGIDEFDYNLSLARLTGEEKSIYDLPSLLREDRFDGMIITGKISKDIICILKKLGKPYVVLGMYSEEVTGESNCVRLNVSTTINKLVDAIKKEGREKIAYFAEHSKSFYEMACFEAFRLKMQSNGLEFDERIIYQGQDVLAGALPLLTPVFADSKIPFDSIICLDFRCAQEISNLILAHYGLKNKIGVLPATILSLPNYRLTVPAIYCKGIADEIAYQGIKTLIMMLCGKGPSQNLKLELTPDLLNCNGKFIKELGTL